MRLRSLISVFLLLASSAAAGAAVHQRDTVGFAAGFNLRPSYVMPTHGFYNGWNPSGKALRNAVAADVNFSVSDPRRGVFQGAGLAVHTFFSNSLLGTPVSLYLFQGAPLACLSENLSAVSRCQVHSFPQIFSNSSTFSLTSFPKTIFHKLASNVFVRTNTNSQAV